MSGYYFKLPLIIDLTIGQQTALDEPNPIAISGGPGTGKRVVSLFRHIRNYVNPNNQVYADPRKKKPAFDIYHYVGPIPRGMLPYQKSGCSS